MKFSPSIFALPSTLVAVLMLANCSSDTTMPANTAGASAAGGKGGGAGAAPIADGPQFAMIRTMIVTSCLGGNGCHGQGDNPMPLANDSTLYASLTGHTSAHCGKVVNTASPADSALVKLLQGGCGTAPNRTDRMPYQKCFDGDKPEENESCIPTATVAGVQAWIAAGAPH